MRCCARATFGSRNRFLRNSRREAGCAQRNTRFRARNIFRRAGDFFCCAIFLQQAKKKRGNWGLFAAGGKNRRRKNIFWECFFLNRRRRFFLLKAPFVQLAIVEHFSGPFSYSPYSKTITRSSVDTKRYWHTLLFAVGFCSLSGTFFHSP